MKKIITILGILMLVMIASVSAYNGDFCTEVSSPCGGGCNSTDLSDMYNGYDFTTDASGVGDITGWDTSCITNIQALFIGSDFNQDISGWNVSNINVFQATFRNSPFNQDISGWDMSNANNTNRMFMDNFVFNQDISGWDMSSVVDIDHMFNDADSSNQLIGSWDTSSVTRMSRVFLNNDGFNQDISSWNTSSVTTMESMFNSASVFNQPLNNWDTSSVTDMSQMFKETSVFNQPLNNWDTSSVTTMESMFNNAQAFDQDIGAWNISSITNFGNFLYLGVLSTTNYDNILSGWSSQSVNSGLYISFGLTKYTDQASRDILTSEPNNWIIVDGGLFVNSAPVINSISPNTRLELTQGESQIYTSNVTDTEDDATYSWTLDGTEVATTESYTANWDNIEAGIYTLQLEVSDVEYSDTESTILEIRAVGGSPSGVSVQTTNDNQITGDVVSTTTDGDSITGVQQVTGLWQRFMNWIRGLFN